HDHEQRERRLRDEESAARDVRRALGAERAALLFGQTIPCSLSRRSVRGVPRRLRSRTTAERGLQGDVRADGRGRNSVGTGRGVRGWFRRLVGAAAAKRGASAGGRDGGTGWIFVYL